MKYFRFSEKGPRMNNEDCLNVVEIADKRTLFVVCDGMGGHSCGEVASIDDETLLHTLQCAKDVEQVAEKYCAICQEKAGDNYTAIIIEME